MSLSKKITAFYIKLAVLIIRLIGWLKSGDAHKNKQQSETFKTQALTNYFTKNYLSVIENMSPKEVDTKNTETIWQFWDNHAGQTTPKIISASIESVERFKGNFKHKILNNSTLENYSDLPGYILDKFNKRRIDYAHFSDLLRLNLLKNHGGIWMDATDYMTNFVPKHIVNQNFFVFLTGNQTNFPYSFVQSCFIRAKKGAFLCEAWYQMCAEYWKKETKKIDYFQIHLMFKTLVLKNHIARDLFAKMPHLSEDETHQLTGDNIIKKFDAGEWERIRKASFFQKTRYMIKKGKIADAADYPWTYFSRLCDMECGSSCIIAENPKIGVDNNDVIQPNS